MTKNAATAHLVQSPTGSWFLAGWGIPLLFGYVRKDGQPMTAADVRAVALCGPMIAGCKTRTWPTREEAVQACTEAGVFVAGESTTAPNEW